METNLKTSRLLLGRIASAHGVRGLVKVLFYGDDPASLEAGPLYPDESAGEGLRLTVKSASGKYWLAEIEKVADRDAADALRHRDLWIDRDALPEAESGEFYHADLTGLAVRGTDGETSGTVVAVQDFGGGTLLEVRPSQGGETFFIPFADEFVPEVNIEGGYLVTTLPRGIEHDG